MSTSLKLKTLWLSMFQPQNSFIVQKSMKSVDGSLNDGRDEYRRRREKNNESVRKSRAKNRMIVQECAQSVQELKNENVILTKQLATLQDELVTLKGLFQHCFSFNLNNLSIKPNDIPTSALYNIIMKKDMKTIKQ